MDYKDTKLIAFIKTFTKKELEEFEKFIVSPYFKKGRDLQPFLKIISKHHPDFDTDKFNEETIFCELYPASEFGDRKSKDILKTLSSSLLKMAEEFLVISNFQKDKILNNRILLDELLDRDLVKYFDQYKETAGKLLNIRGGNSGQNMLEKYFFEGINTRYYAQVLDFKNYYEHAIKSGDFISCYFLSNLLRISKLKSLTELGRNIKPDNDIIDYLLKSIDMKEILSKFKDTDSFVFIGFHYYTYICIKNNFDLENYKKAKDIFFKYKTQLSLSEKFYFYADLINLLNISYSRSHTLGTRKEIFEMFKFCIEDNAYKISTDDLMPPDFYRNAILNAIFFKEYEWADNFINVHSGELKPAFRENLKYYSKTLIYFAQGEFEKALECISKVKYDLDVFKIDIKIISLKIYYELDLTEPAFSMIDSFKHFLRSKKELTKELRIAYNDFVMYYSKLLNMKIKQNKDDAGFIKEEITKNYLIAQKKWLLDKLVKL